jgi:hypothetical protein
MNEMANAAYIMAQAACAQVEAMGMQAANSLDIQNGVPPRYDEEHFKDLLVRYGIHHNAVIGSFHR